MSEYCVHYGNTFAGGNNLLSALTNYTILFCVRFSDNIKLNFLEAKI